MDNRKEDMMAAVPVSDLVRQIEQVRANPGIPYEHGGSRSHEDLRDTMSGVRAALIEAIAAAPDGAFDKQPENDAGAEVWSVGEIVGHCNGAALNIGRSASELIGLDASHPPQELLDVSEPRVMTRDEALTAARIADFDIYYTIIPDDERLDNAGNHDFFGPVNARSWLYFMALHEAEHVEQIRSLG